MTPYQEFKALFHQPQLGHFYFGCTKFEDLIDSGNNTYYHSSLMHSFQFNGLTLTRIRGFFCVFGVLISNVFMAMGTVSAASSEGLNSEERSVVLKEMEDFKQKRTREYSRRILSITSQLLNYQKHLERNPGSATKPYLKLPFVLEERPLKNFHSEGSIVIAEIIDQDCIRGADIKMNDTIVAVDGIPVHSMKDVEKALRGISNEQVKLTTSREGEKSIDQQVALLKLWRNFTFHVGGKSTAIAAYTDGRENIYVSQAMLRYIKSDDELAFILAHEIAHIELGHYANMAITNTLAIIPAVFAGAFVEREIKHSGGITTSLAYQTIRSPFSKEREIAADERALYYLKAGGFDMDAGKKLLKRFAVELPTTTQASFISTHPASPERLERLSEKSLYNKINLKEQIHADGAIGK